MVNAALRFAHVISPVVYEPHVTPVPLCCPWAFYIWPEEGF